MISTPNFVQVCSHGIEYGLACPPDPDFGETTSRQGLEGKKDTKTCKACRYVEYFMRKVLPDAISESRTEANKASVEDALRYTKDSLDCFHLFQGHRVRVCNQQQASSGFEKEMYDEVARTKEHGTIGLLVIDWGMNYEGERKNESQVHNYGKRGHPWHIGYLKYYVWDAEREEPVPVYVSLDQITKGNKKCGMAVLSLLEAAVLKIAAEIPQLKLLGLASDNASNYHRYVKADRGCRFSFGILVLYSLGTSVAGKSSFWASRFSMRCHHQ